MPRFTPPILISGYCNGTHFHHAPRSHTSNGFLEVNFRTTPHERNNLGAPNYHQILRLSWSSNRLARGVNLRVRDLRPSPYQNSFQPWNDFTANETIPSSGITHTISDPNADLIGLSSTPSPASVAVEEAISILAYHASQSPDPNSDEAACIALLRKHFPNPAPTPVTT